MDMITDTEITHDEAPTGPLANPNRIRLGRPAPTTPDTEATTRAA